MYQRKKIDSRANCEPPVPAEDARELAAIEAELAALSPGPSHLDRDRTMFLAGRAAAGSKTTSTVSTLAARRWTIGFATMTAVAGCLLVALIVQQRSIIALRTTMPTTTIETAKIESATAQSTVSPEPSVYRDLAGDFEQRRFDFSGERLLTLADSGTLTVRSFLMADEPRTAAAAKSAPTRDWPQQTYAPPSPPLPYYKLLKQLQAAEI